MSVFVKITTPGGAVYRVSDGPTEHSGFAWRPILTNTVPIERAARATENGIPTTAQTLNIWNAERYIGVVDALLNDALTDSTVEIEVSEIQGGWNGIIKAWEQGSNGLLSIRSGQDTLAVFKRQVPDETIRLVTFTGASREAVNTTIPTVIGGTTSDPVPVPGILIDRVGFTWAFCVGKCRSIVRVMRDRKVITTGFTTYLGAADQAIWPGMVCVKFAADPRDSNGAWPEITAELVGLEIGSTEAEGRNPARVIRAHLTTADTGACGWGLGEPADSIDTASFDQAVLDCDTLGLHLDGMMSQAALSSYWLSQMCLGGRLRLDKPAGKWRLRVDVATDSVKEYDADNILSYSFWPGDSSLRHKKARVEYRADFITKQFLGSATRTIGTIGEEENLLEQHLVRDHTTGNAIADYVANIEKFGELRMQIQTPDVAVGARTLEEDEVVTIRVPEFPGGRLFRVTALSQGTDESRVELRSYADAIFDLAAPVTSTDPALDPIVRSAPLPPPPMVPSGLSLVTSSRIQPDGTLIVWVDGVYTPGAGCLITRVEFGEGASPAAWTELVTVTNGQWHHEPVKPGQIYTYRITSINTGGESATVTGSIQAANDTTAPLVPQTPVLSTYFKSIAVKCLQNLTKAPDHASFDVYRNTTNNSGTATKIGSAPCLGNTDSVVYLDEATAFDTTYYYWVKSVDTSGNISGFSAVAGPVSTQRIIAGDIGTSALNSSALFVAGVVDAAALAECAVTAAKTCLAAISRTTGSLNAGTVGTIQMVDSAITNAKISAGALAMPGGAVASYSAKGSTTAEIAVSGGFKDVSGRGYHGTALCGVAVCQDPVYGSVFGFDGVDSYAAAAATPFINHCCFSVSWRQKTCGVASGMTGVGYWNITYLPNARAGADGCLQLAIRNGNNQTVYLLDTTSHFDDQWHHFVFTATCSCLCLFRDGVFVNSATIVGLSWPWNTSLILGRNINNGTEFLCGCLAQWKLYNRVLSDAEVKTLYQFPDDVVFGNITADLLAANSVTAGKICAGAIQACHIAADAIEAGAIKAGAVCAGKLAANSIYGCNIIAGTICSAQIGACQIATCNLAAGVITSEKIVATGITGACICAGTITASHLLIAAPGSALNDDPGTADITAWTLWQGYQASIATVTDGKVGNTVLRSPLNSSLMQSRAVPVDPTKVYRVRTWARKSPTGTVGTFTLGLRIFNASGVSVPAANSYSFCVVATLTTNWQEVAFLFGPGTTKGAIDSTGRTMSIVFGAYVGSGGYSEAQDIRIEEVLPATLIQDGAITTEKIIATGISGACICAGSITTTHLAAAGICADCVKAGTLTGVTVCATAGNIGGWSVTSSWIGKNDTCGTMTLYSSYSSFCMPMIEAGGKVSATTRWINMGHIYWKSGYQCAWGFSVNGSGTDTFAVGQTLGTGVTFPDGCAIACDKTFFWIGNTTKYMKWDSGSGDLVVKGTVYATAGCFTGTINATSGTFSGELSGATGSFCGILLTGRSTYNSSEVSVPVYPTAQCYFWIQAGYYCSSIADYFGCRLAYGKLLISADAFEIYGPFGISNSSSGWGSGISVSALKRSSTKGYTFYFYKNTDRYLYIKVVAPSGSFEPTSQNAYTGTATMTMLQTVDMLGTVSLTQPSGTLTLQCTISIT